MAIYDREGIKEEHKFDTVEEAFQYFEDNFNYKYDIFWCYIADKLSCIIGSSSAEDYEIFGSLQQEIVKWMSPCLNIFDVDGVSTDLTSAMRDKMYDLVEEWGLVDIYYFADEF